MRAVARMLQKVGVAVNSVPVPGPPYCSTFHQSKPRGTANNLPSLRFCSYIRCSHMPQPLRYSDKIQAARGGIHPGSSPSVVNIRGTARPECTGLHALSGNAAEVVEPHSAKQEMIYLPNKIWQEGTYRKPRQAGIRQKVVTSFFRLPAVFYCSLVTGLALLFQFIDQPAFTWVFLLSGFFTVGLSHGALDHITEQKVRTRTGLALFILRYVGKAGALGVVWFWLPDVVLLSFILFSAWHFGQGDFQEWKYGYGFLSFGWGLCVLGMLLSFHLPETREVLALIPHLQVDTALASLNAATILYWQVGFSLLGLALAWHQRSLLMTLSLMNLLLLGYLPLIVSFGIYFVFQHSLHGWKHLKTEVGLSSKTMWTKALPFSLAGAVVIIFFVVGSDSPDWGLFFMLLACISMPHVLCMDSFYRVRKV